MFDVRFSKAQLTILQWVARISSALSILGSATIIYMILRRRKIRLALIHNRLIMGMSLNDILRSLSLGVCIAAAPREFNIDHYPVYYPAYGNDATCSAQGFFMILGLSVPAYNAALSVYYLLVIRYNIREDVLKDKYEKYMHLIPFIIPLIFAIWAISMDLIRSYGELFCFVVPDRYKDDIQDYDFQIASLYAKILGSVVCFIFIIIVISMGAVYHTVRKQEQTMQQYDVRREILDTNSRRNIRQNTMSRRVRGGGTNRDRGNAVEGSRQETAAQAFLYAGAYFFTFIFPGIVRLQSKDASFTLTLLMAIFLPLQGFWNFLAFVRPKYVALRKKNRTRSCLWIWKAAIFSSLEEEERKKPRRGRTSLPTRFSIALPVQEFPQSHSVASVGIIHDEDIMGSSSSSSHCVSADEDKSKNNNSDCDGSLVLPKNRSDENIVIETKNDDGPGKAHDDEGCNDHVSHNVHGCSPNDCSSYTAKMRSKGNIDKDMNDKIPSGECDNDADCHDLSSSKGGGVTNDEEMG